jgi:DNA-binding beta-propeller fold protein YncE
MKPGRILCVTILAFSLLPALSAHSAGQYVFEKEIPVGGQGGWDCLWADADAKRLYVSHATKVVVIDTEKEAVMGEVTDTPGVHGIAIAADLQKGFTSNGKENKVSIFDLQTLKTLSKVDVGENPDVIIYEPGKQEVYCFNGKGQSASVIDAKTGKVAATILLPGKPEFAVADAKQERVYCNIEDKNEIVAIDTKTHAVVNTWPITPGEEASGLAIDTENHRLFPGCHNQLMVMLDSTSGKVLANVPIGKGVDGTAFDPGTQLAFSSNGEGNVTVAHEEAPDKLTVVQTLATEPGARTMALDTKTHKIYLATAKFEAQPEPSPGAPRRSVFSGYRRRRASWRWKQI